MNKIQAAGLHFLLSVAFIGGFIVFLNFFWYKNLFQVTGVIEPLKLLVIIDVFLGPLLTFIVYKHGKRTLKLDLAVIVSLQLAAFVYGSYVVYQGKPSWLVFNGDAFEIVYEKEVPNRDNVMQNDGLFSQPKLAQIPFMEQSIGIRAHQNVEAFKPFSAKDWGEVNYQSLSIKQAAALIAKDEEDILKRMPSPTSKIFQISNDGIKSLLVVEDLSKLSYRVIAN